MTIFDQLTEDMKRALKAGEKERLSTIRLLRGQLKNSAIDKQADLTEAEEIAVLNSAAKKRRESIEAFGHAGRQDLVDKETAELAVILSYLPQPLSDREVEAIVDEVIAQVGALSPKEIGKVMPLVMARVQGRADGKKVNEMVRLKLS
ncbi:MAG TPA: GatB/YqeY domain-containing protein [bacterium]|nr:GatB/YqeY domain-containing protein [bacterium]HNT66661.1 GatB/YqeY domain-containing protein [bacterium]HOX87215.1 GatB/YqeY domain-containing protein [bacterium]HPG46676.1 GatB/YqeY domain-containing protein [bacterium]HPM98792.1 GatB/YqeY domain-containing protein [bacterium]